MIPQKPDPKNEPLSDNWKQLLDVTKINEQDLKTLTKELIVAIFKSALVPIVAAGLRNPSPDNIQLVADGYAFARRLEKHNFDKKDDLTNTK